MKISNLKEFFEYLNKQCTYLVLRNWQDLLDDSIYGSGHEDIDVLCDDLEAFIQLTGAKRIHKEKFRDNFIIIIGGNNIRFDIRWVGDNYYPIELEKKMLEGRILNQNNIYIPCPEDYFYTLAYHALIQKPVLSSEYISKLNKVYLSISNIEQKLDKNQLITLLSDYLKHNNYKVVISKDFGVYFNYDLARMMPVNIDMSLQFKKSIFILKQRLLSHLKR